MSGINTVVVDTKCSFCGKEIVGIAHKPDAYPRDKGSQMSAYQCEHCETIVCMQCKGKRLKWSIWSAFSKTECPNCNRIFGRGLIYEGYSVKEIKKEREERMERIARANQGRFLCGAFESDQELNGSYCYLYGDQSVNVVFEESGLTFGPLLFYKGKTSAAVGKSSQNMSMGSLLVTAATTETIHLCIPWADLKEYRIEPWISKIIFNNQEKKREEWFEFAVFKTHEKDIQDMFTNHLRKYAVKIDDQRTADGNTTP